MNNIAILYLMIFFIIIFLWILANIQQIIIQSSQESRNIDFSKDWFLVITTHHHSVEPASKFLSAAELEIIIAMK